MAKRKCKTKRSAIGFIDHYANNTISGWFFSHTGQVNHDNEFYVRVGGYIIGPLLANQFRQDVKDYGYGDGRCGFQVYIPPGLVDGNSHDISLIDAYSKKVIDKKCVVIDLDSSAKILGETLIERIKLGSCKTGQKIAIVAGFTNSRTTNLTHAKLLNYFKERGFYVILSLSTDNDYVSCKDVYKFCDEVLLRKNVGYDFGSWAHAYMSAYKYVYFSSSVVFVNDSIAGPIDCNNKVIEIDDYGYDVCAITDSYQEVYHLQSYFWRVNSRVIKSGQLDEFLFNNYNIPLCKEEAIRNFELNTAKFFSDKGFTVGAAMDLARLHTRTCNAFKEKSSKVQSTLKEYMMGDVNGNPIFTNVLAKIYMFHAQLLGSDNLNPSHYYWREVIECGFPFIKKELLTKNPTNYPFVDEFSLYFRSVESKKLLEDIIRGVPIVVSHNTYFHDE